MDNDLLKNAPIEELIDLINHRYLDEATRCRILLAALLLRLAPKEK